jgi:hypothetical protein
VQPPAPSVWKPAAQPAQRGGAKPLSQAQLATPPASVQVPCWLHESGVQPWSSTQAPPLSCVPDGQAQLAVPSAVALQAG